MSTGPTSVLAALSSAPPVEVVPDVELDQADEVVPVEVDVVELCATDVTPGPVENAGGFSLLHADARAAAASRRWRTRAG